MTQTYLGDETLANSNGLHLTTLSAPESFFWGTVTLES